MSQVNSAGVVVSNSITSWNRTPGKPGVGSNNPSFPPNRWSSNKVPIAGSDLKRDLPIEDRTDKSSMANPDTAHLWPPIFDSSRMADNSSSAFVSTSDQGTGMNQWTVPSFAGPGGSNSLLNSTDSVSSSNATAWPLLGSSNNCSGIPRAITGQQPGYTAASCDGDPSRRFLSGNGVASSGSSGWPLNSDSSDLLPDSSSNLSMALSKMNVNNPAAPSGCCFQPIHDYADGQSIVSSGVSKPGDSSCDLTYEHKARSRSSTEMVELEALFASDPEEAIRTVVNAAEPWGLNPVNQSTPWDLSEISTETAHSGSSPAADVPLPSTRLPGGLFDAQNSTTAPQRRLVSLSGSSIGGRDSESNVWPSEPPNGTGIWESHYESLGERTARWQPTSHSNSNQSGFTPHQTGFSVPPSAATTRTELLPSLGTGNSLRNFARPNTGPYFPSGHTGVGKAIPIASHPIGPSVHNITGGSSRGFPLTGSSNLGAVSGPWPFPPGPNATDPTNRDKGRWPSANFSRIANKQQPVAHLLPNQNNSGLRWPLVNNTPHVPTGWPLNDLRRPNLMPGGWSNVASGDNAPYFGQPHQLLPPVTRMCQPGSLSTEFPTSVIPPPRGGSGTTNQVFRAPHSAFYPSVNSASSSTNAQRLFLSPQQHSQQLQQQSVLRANAMRHLINLGFPDEEIQSIFSDINTNVERALIDLRDRTCHPGLDELIKAFANSGLMQVNSVDDGIALDRSDPLSGPRGLRSAPNHNMFDQPVPKNMNVSSGNLPTESLELSIHLLQQRETQILQTIMQLQSKHQELNQKLNQIRTSNLPFATNPVTQELQLQSIQVASQIDAQHAQLKQIRSQTGVLKQIAASSHLAHSHQQSNLPISGSSNTSAFSPPTSAMWLPGTSSSTPVMCTGYSNPQQLQSQMSEGVLGVDQGLDTQEQPIKLGSGSFLWESGPWSGSGSRNAGDSYPSVDRRWSSAAFQTKPSYGALGDPRWVDVSAGDASGVGLPDSRFVNDTDTAGGSDDSGSKRRSGSSKSWLLAHNIPPHVSVSVIKVAVSAALVKHAKAMGSDRADTQQDFELHPNMSARWVLIGLTNSGDASVVQEYLESPGSEQNGIHYGLIKPISPSDALLRLQDIQSLASRFRAFGSNEPSSSTGNQRSGSQPNSVVNFSISSSSDLTGLNSGGVSPDSLNPILNASDTN